MYTDKPDEELEENEGYVVENKESKITSAVVHLKVVYRQGYCYFRVPKDIAEDLGLKKDSRCQVAISYLGYEKISPHQPKHLSGYFNKKKQ